MSSTWLLGSMCGTTVLGVTVVLARLVVTRVVRRLVVDWKVEFINEFSHCAPTHVVVASVVVGILLVVLLQAAL